MNKVITDLTADRIAQALFMFGLGIVAATDTWWPGLIINFGVAYAAWLVLHGRYWASAVVSVFFAVVPVMYLISSDVTAFVPAVFLGLGASGLARAALKNGDSHHSPAQTSTSRNRADER